MRPPYTRGAPSGALAVPTPHPPTASTRPPRSRAPHSQVDLCTAVYARSGGRRDRRVDQIARRRRRRGSCAGRLHCFLLPLMSDVLIDRCGLRRPLLRCCSPAEAAFAARISAGRGRQRCQRSPLMEMSRILISTSSSAACLSRRREAAFCWLVVCLFATLLKQKKKPRQQPCRDQQSQPGPFKPAGPGSRIITCVAVGYTMLSIRVAALAAAPHSHRHPPQRRGSAGTRRSFGGKLPNIENPFGDRPGATVGKLQTRVARLRARRQRR